MLPGKAGTIAVYEWMGALAVQTPKSNGFINDLKKSVPYESRRWEPNRRVWLVDPGYRDHVQTLIISHYNQYVDIPTVSPRAEEMRVLDVRYVGATKPRDSGADLAFGYSSGDWNVLFPRAVLERWFGASVDPAAASTLYGLLGIHREASAEEVKTAYRRMAKQWHPDVCKEPNATQVFQRIQDAYQVLRDWRQRGRYDAGLALEAAITTGRKDFPAQGYRSPLRCGNILAKGFQIVGRFNVTEILTWADIMNARGETLVTSWPAGAKHFREDWIK